MSATPLFSNRVDWTKWASTAPERECEACQQPFAPNHPRRRFCGKPECPGRQRPPRARTPSASRTPRARPPRARRGRESRTLQTLIAEATVAGALTPAGVGADELLMACADLARAARENRPPAAERAAVIRVLNIAAARAATLEAP